MNTIIIACDGACSGNGKDNSPGGWGAVLTYKGNTKELYGVSPNTTNNIMELTAAIEALSAIKTTNIPIKIFSDSAYVVNCFIQKWYLSWEKNGWKNAARKPVENKELWEKLLSLYRKQSSVEFIKVKGHIDPNDNNSIKTWYDKLSNKSISMEEYKKAIILNNRADELATKFKESPI